MGLSFYVAGRRQLPAAAHGTTWSLSLDFDEDEDAGVDLDVYRLDDDAERRFTALVGFEPACVVVLDPAWEASEAVALELARALEGAVWCDVDNVVLFDARGDAAPSTSLEELEARLDATMQRAGKAWLEGEERAANALKERFAGETAKDPKGVASDNDWSDV